MQLRAELYTGEILEFSCALQRFVIGRSPKCEVVLPIEGVSRQHLRVELHHGDVYITDLDSANGVFINNERLKPETRVKYQTFFHLSFGPVKELQIIFERTTMFSIPANQLEKKAPAPQAAAQPAAKKPVPAPMKARSKKDSSSKVLVILAIALLSAAVYYQKMFGTTTAEQKDTTPKKSEKGKAYDEYF